MTVWISIRTVCLKLEQRISRQIALARKHQVMPEELPAVYQAMLEEQRLLD